MNTKILVLILSVGFLNVLLHAFLDKIGKKNLNLIESLLSLDFAITFIIGVSSVVLMLLVYKSNINLAQGIIIMGATFIIIGTLAGIILKNNTLSFYDWILFGILIIFYTSKWIFDH